MTENDWCMDTGARKHMCWDKSLIKTFTEKCVWDNVTIADGKSVENSWCWNSTFIC